ncbi:MAG: prepilin-type N-terminal cleavage/methylation domain-containing protein [Planctomycetes bacterium]|nr:prepilin-type N-terminal cleavage/methylation domain-containing protein [Planctomycetota bacterium]
MVNHNNHKISLRNGFSMMELVLVLSIIGILASVTVVSVQSSIQNSQLQYAADKLITDLLTARDQARTDQISYTLTFDIANRNYQAPGVKRLTDSEDIAVNLKSRVYQVTSITCDLGGDNFVTFDDQGKTEQNGDIILSRGSKQITIFITPNGKIRQYN